MRERGTVIPVRMSLSVQPKSSKVDCAFSCNGEELSRQPASLPDRQLLDAYHREINSVAAGLPVKPSHTYSMKSELQKIIPGPVADFVHGTIEQGRQSRTLALEVMLN